MSDMMLKGLKRGCFWGVKTLLSPVVLCLRQIWLFVFLGLICWVWFLRGVGFVGIVKNGVFYKNKHQIIWWLNINVYICIHERYS